MKKKNAIIFYIKLLAINLFNNYQKDIVKKKKTKVFKISESF